MQLTTMDGLIPKIQSLSLSSMQLSQLIEDKNKELSNLPEVIRLRGEIRELESKVYNNFLEKKALEDEGKEILLSANVKEFVALDGTKVSLSFTPGSLVVEEGATIPPEYYNLKTEKVLDKKLLKEAITQGTFEDDKVYIQKETKLLIKHQGS